MIVDLHTATGAVGDFEDLDTGVGTDEHAVIALGLPSAGGHVVGGTPTNPLRIDPTGATVQPVSATTLPLPAGAATEATLITRSTEATLATRASEVTLAALFAAFGLEDFASETTLASLEAKDFATQTTLASLLAAFSAEDFSSETTLAALLAAFSVEDFSSETTLAALLSAFSAEDFSSETTLAALLSAFSAEDFASQTTLATMLTEAAFQARINTLGQKAMSASTPVVIASDQSAIVPFKAGTSATSQPAASATVITVLAANTARLGATVVNDSNKNMRMKFGATATAADFTVLLGRDAYYEVPFNYTGVLTAIWDSGVTGNARVTEVTA